MNVEKTLEERETRYGSFEGHAEISQQLKDVINVYKSKRGCNLSADQSEALEMIAHKIARILNGDPDYADNWHDIAGYATLVDKRLKK